MLEVEANLVVPSPPPATSPSSSYPAVNVELCSSVDDGWGRLVNRRGREADAGHTLSGPRWH
jgi:hypothetical protein